MVLAVALFSPIPYATRASTLPKNPIAVACNDFLPNLFNPNAGLLSEYPGSNSDYVASDNLLFVRTFDLVCYGGHPSLADEIRTSITRNACCNEANDSMHEVVFGLRIPLPIHTANLYNVNSTWRGYCCYPPWANYTVYYENHNSTGILSDAQYGDVAAYTALELELGGDHIGALHEIALLNWMYNGRGIADDVYRYGVSGERGIYQTFKDALYMLALVKTGQYVPPGLEKTILSMQGPDGGFHTGYDETENHTGTKENVETTTLAILALHSLPANIQIEPYPYSNITGTGTMRTVKVVPFFSNIGNWTVTVNVTAFWDNTIDIIGNTTLILSPVGQGGVGLGTTFSHNVTFDPATQHFLRIYAGNSSLRVQVYSPPRNIQPPWWISFWYAFPITIAATIAFILLYRRRRLGHSQFSALKSDAP